MALLMVRDWRTRLVGEFGTRVELCQFLEKGFQPFDVLVLDVDLFGEDFTIAEICDELTQRKNHSRILLTGIQPEERIIRQMNSDRVCGYVLKHEVGYSLSWIITLHLMDPGCFSPGTMDLAVKMNATLPPTSFWLTAENNCRGSQTMRLEVARFAFIFSLGRRDLADELKISDNGVTVWLVNYTKRWD